MYCFSDHLFKPFFYPLIFISNQYFGSTTVTVRVHLTRATNNPSRALVVGCARLCTEWGERCG